MQAANGLLQQATAGFGPQEELSPWKVLATMVGEAASAFKPVAFVDNPGTDTQVGDEGGRGRKGGQVVVGREREGGWMCWRGLGGRGGGGYAGGGWEGAEGLICRWGLEGGGGLDMQAGAGRERRD